MMGTGVMIKEMMISEGNGSGQDDCSDQFHKDDKLHGEAECTAKISNQNQLHQVMDG